MNKSLLLLVLALPVTLSGQAISERLPEKLRIIAFGAHPDDCDIRMGGVAAK